MGNYNLLDPNDENLFRQEAKQSGASDSDINLYVSRRKKELAQPKMSLSPFTSMVQSGQADFSSIPQQYREQVAQEMSLLPATGKKLPAGEIGKIADFQEGLNTLDNLESVLEEKKGIFGPIRGMIGKANPYALSAKELDAELAIATQLIGKALEGGVLRKEDEAKYRRMLPQITDTKEAAAYKLQAVKERIRSKMAESKEQLSAAGYAVPQTEPSTGLGEPELGTPIRNNESGLMRPYGDEEDVKVVKSTADRKLVVDDKVIQFLVNSNFLPVAGSIIGGLAGAGVASIGTGAAGAATGAALKRGLRELLDPDGADLSDHARIVMTEGVTDAIMGGLTLGIGKVAGKGFQAVLKQAPAKGVVKEGGESVMNRLVKRVIGEPEDVLKGAAKITPTKSAEFLQTFDEPAESVFTRYVGNNIKNAKDMDALYELSKATKGEAGEMIGKAIKGKFLSNPDDLLKSLNEAKKSANISGVIGEEATTGLRMIDDTIQRVQNEIVEVTNRDGVVQRIIPAEAMNKIASTLKKAYRGSDIEMSKKLGKQAHAILRKELGSVAGYNDAQKLYRAASLFEDATAKQLGKVNKKAAVDFMDMMTVGGSMMAGSPVLGMGIAAARKALNAAAKDPETQLMILSKTMNQAQERGNKQAVRTLWRLMQDIPGLEISIDPMLFKHAVRAGSNIRSEAFNQLIGNQPDPGIPTLDMEQQSTPSGQPSLEMFSPAPERQPLF